MKILKISLIVIGILVLLIVFSLVSVKLFFTQGVIDEFEINSPEAGYNILIASQKSNFKNSLVERLVDDLNSDSTYIKVIDVTELSGINDKDWNAMILINTCEAGMMQKDVIRFLSQTAYKDRIILLTTSGSGVWKPADSPVDTFSSASKKESIDSSLDYIKKRIEQIKVIK